MTNRSLLVGLLLGVTSLPLACSGESTTTGGTSGKAGSSGKAGGSGNAGRGAGGAAGSSVTSSGGAQATAGRAGGFGNGGSGTGFGGRGMGVGGRAPFGGSGRSGSENTGETGGQPDQGADLGVAERAPYCGTVCAYGPTASSRLVGADAGAAGTTETGGSAGTGDTTGSGGEAPGGAPGSAGEGGAPASTPCGNEAACVAALCPTQASEHCGELLTAFVACMANADADLVASLVTSCTEAQGPSLDTLIYQACYGQYADFTRGCL